MVDILKKIGFSGGFIDPCLFSRKNENGLVLIALYVDDNLMIGHSEAINEAIAQLRQNGLVLKVENELTDYLSCEIKFSKNASCTAEFSEVLVIYFVQAQ